MSKVDINTGEKIIEKKIIPSRCNYRQDRSYMPGKMSNAATFHRLPLRFLESATKLPSPLGERLIKFLRLSFPS